MKSDSESTNNKMNKRINDSIAIILWIIRKVAQVACRGSHTSSTAVQYKL